MEGAWNEDAAVKAGQDALRREAIPEEAVAPSGSPRLQETRCPECDGLSCTDKSCYGGSDMRGGIVDFGFRIQGPGRGGRLHRSLTLPADLGQLMYPGPVLMRSYWETVAETKLKLDL